MYTNFDQLPLLITVDVLSDVLDISKTNAYNLVRSDKLKVVKIGKQYRVPKEALIDYLRAAG